MTGNDFRKNVFQNLLESLDDAFDELEYLKYLYEELAEEIDTALNDIREQIDYTNTILTDCRKDFNREVRKRSYQRNFELSAPTEEEPIL